MAALLPHQELSYTRQGDVLVDGLPMASLDQRNRILSGVEGVAIKADDLLEMKKEEGRAFVKDKRVIYIYHNVIDSTGDSAGTEGHTFEAVRRTIQELISIAGYVINNLNGHHVLITADHGFLFTESAPGEPDKSNLADKPAGTVKAKKRYLIGTQLGDHDNVWHGWTAVTSGAKGDMEFWIPKGTNRFHFTGGARYVHGGAMLQEIVVPVVTVRHIKGKDVGGTKTKPVTVHVLGTSHKITTEYFYEEGQKGSPFMVRELRPVQMPNMDMTEFFEGRRHFTETQWLDVLLRSTGLEPTHFDERVKWHLLTRMGSTKRMRYSAVWSMHWRPAAGSKNNSKKSGAWNSTMCISPTSIRKIWKSPLSVSLSREAAP